MADEKKSEPPKSPPGLNLAGMQPTSPKADDEVMLLEPPTAPAPMGNATAPKREREQDQNNLAQHNLAQAIQKIAYLRSDVHKHRNAVTNLEKDYANQQSLMLQLKSTIRHFETPTTTGSTPTQSGTWKTKSPTCKCITKPSSAKTAISKRES